MCLAVEHVDHRIEGSRVFTKPFAGVKGKDRYGPGLGLDYLAADDRACLIRHKLIQLSW